MLVCGVVYSVVGFCRYVEVLCSRNVKTCGVIGVMWYVLCETL